MAEDNITFGKPLASSRARDDSGAAGVGRTPAKPKGGTPYGVDGENGIDSWLPWLMASGGGLLAHSIASSMFDDKTDDEKRKESVWSKLLRTILPLGIGVAGAYGGYRLGEGLGQKTAQANNEGEKIFPFLRKGRSKGYEYAPESLTNMVDRVDTWGRENNYGPDVDISDVGRNYASEQNLWANGMRYGAFLPGGVAAWNAYAALKKLPFYKPTVPTVSPEEAARAERKLNARELTDAERAQSLKRIAELDDAMASGKLTAADINTINEDINSLRGSLQGGRSATAIQNNASILEKIRRLEAMKTTGGILPPDRAAKYRAAKQNEVEALEAKKPSAREAKKLQAKVDAFNRSQKGLPTGSWKESLRNLTQALVLAGAAHGMNRVGKSLGEDATRLNNFADTVKATNENANNGRYVPVQ